MFEFIRLPNFDRSADAVYDAFVYYLRNQFKLGIAAKSEKTGDRKFLSKKEAEINYHVCRHFTIITTYTHTSADECRNNHYGKNKMKLHEIKPLKIVYYAKILI